MVKYDSSVLFFGILHISYIISIVFKLSDDWFYTQLYSIICSFMILTSYYIMYIYAIYHNDIKLDLK